MNQTDADVRQGTPKVKENGSSGGNVFLDSTLIKTLKSFYFIFDLSFFADDRAQFIDSPAILARRVITMLDDLIVTVF